MEARSWNPIFGLAIAVSISCAAQAQYAQFVHPQQMVIAPQAMPMMTQALPPRAFAGPVMASAPMIHNPAASTAQPSRRQGQAVAESDNFIVFASDKNWAEEVAKTAEKQRRELAEHWLGRALPPWSGRCPIHVHDAPELGAGGETRFVVQQGVASSWMMSVQGTRERILDSVLPHEISHTIFATHFGRLNKYVPRWADEGAATTVEHEAEKSKHRFYLRKFLQTGRGLAFNKMFQLKEYPKDILPLYAQGHSAVQFLIDQSDPNHFIKFLELGMQTEDWTGALAKFYGYETIGDFQTRWNKWLFDGSPADLVAYAPLLIKQQNSPVSLASASLASNAQEVATGSLSPDPQSLEMLPSHAQANQGGTDLATNIASQNDNTEFVPNQQNSLVSLDDAIALAAQQPSQQSSQVSADSAAGESWYKRKLRQTSGQPATPIPQHNNFPPDTSAIARTPAAEGNFASNAMSGLRPATQSLNSTVPSLQPGGTTTALPQQSQGPNVQVLEWGQGLRLSGPGGEVPRYR